MTNKKCQPKHGLKVHDLMIIHMLKMTCWKWLSGFFTPFQNGYFLTKKIDQKN
jgi:hypothetical protein